MDHHDPNAAEESKLSIHLLMGYPLDSILRGTNGYADKHLSKGIKQISVEPLVEALVHVPFPY